MQRLDLFQLPNDFRGKPGWYVQLWWITQALLFNTSPQFLYGWRRFLLRSFGASIGKDVILRPSLKVTYPWKLTIGDNSWVGDEVVLYSLGDIEIGSNAVISQKSYLCTGGHDYQSISFDIFSKPIVVEDGAWIATDVFISPGVRIGKNAVVGARSTVLTDVPEGWVCVGSPLRFIKHRVMES